MAITIIIVCFLFLSNSFASKTEGTIEVSVVNLNGDTIVSKKIAFLEGDSIERLLTDNFENVVIKDGFLYSIDKLSTPEDWSTFICLYVDGQMSDVGILEIKFKNGTKISFVDTETQW